jgi:uncharacterized protein (DUF2132 family)
MAILTYDPTPADQPEFNEDEQDSLRVGEEQSAAEQQMLAGKFTNAEELEKAYIELQKKLGSNGQEDETVRDSSGDQEREEQQEVEEPSEVSTLISNATAEWERTGEVSPEMLSKFKEMSSEDLVNAYIGMYGADRVQDLSDSQVTQLKNSVGGEEQFNTMIQWAQENLDPSYVQAYDNLVDTGDFQSIQLAVAGMKSAYEANVGYEGRMLTGKAAATSGAPVFRSQAEVVAAMNDPRYDNDPAYRNDVFAKLERSNLQF